MYWCCHLRVNLLINFFGVFYFFLEISIMILHRPGCDYLDTFVRDLSFIIYSYDIKVTSPLLEMSNIDAQGGLASYISRNIDTCTYVLVLVTEHTPGVTLKSVLIKNKLLKAGPHMKYFFPLH